MKKEIGTKLCTKAFMSILKFGVEIQHPCNSNPRVTIRDI